MNILDAAHHTVRQFKGGAAALAVRMGMRSVAVLNSKVNPNTETHHLTLMEASTIMTITGNYRILQALCAEHGKVAINLPNIPECRDTALTDLVLSVGMGGGDICAQFKEMMADGRITRGEAIDMSKVIHAMHEVLAELEAQINKCVEQ
ncbi:phage regulatory CII family protein [Acinetobacter johnsonii]|nr:phage regulatory CII family protein [Acinetobacter johnsonii]